MLQQKSQLGQRSHRVGQASIVHCQLQGELLGGLQSQYQSLYMGVHVDSLPCGHRTPITPMVCEAPAPEGWWFPPGVKDGSLPCPTVLVPKGLLLWDLRQKQNFKYGITNSPFWHADDHMATFTRLKQDMQSFEEFFSGDFNSQRFRMALQHRTVGSEYFPKNCGQHVDPCSSQRTIIDN